MERFIVLTNECIQMPYVPECIQKDGKYHRKHDKKGIDALLEPYK